MLRQVIVTIMGNVDAGKSETIDCIKKTSIVASEPGKITQSIKAYSIDLDTIKLISKGLIDDTKIKVPGLLFIDTPGHKAFTNLRKRGGSLADIAILIVDINEGLKPQTLESIEILKENKTPFIIALNKIDLIHNWISDPENTFLKNIQKQKPEVQKLIEEKLYSLVGKLYELNLNTERFDRVEDFTKQIAMIPMSARTSEGIPELLMMLTGLAQKFLEAQLNYDPEAPAEGTILEVNEEKGLGICIDVIIHKGKLELSDTIVVGTLQEPIVTKVKAIFLAENKGLKKLDEAKAAIGVKIAAPALENAIPGMPLKVANKNLEKTKIEIKKQVEELTLELDQDGIIIKADNLGSLEGLINLLKEKGIKIKRASIGDISKKDIAEALSSAKRLHKVILGFNIKSIDSEEVKILTNNVIYSLIEKFEEWYNKEKAADEAKLLSGLVKPAKIKILRDNIFRQSNPAVCGIEVLAGTLKPATNLMKDGEKVTEAKEIQNDGKTLSELKKGEQAALSMPGVTIGRQIKEEDILYTDVPEEHFKKYKKIPSLIRPEEIQILKEIAEIKRKSNPSWGM
ncbi:MAG TPA: translation initiation factor IF-2 [Candidatus Nanoarchaeia archaeon]|nr:translation initiation factor IF-2 [Candidatus Nanoarchaeia archaeon]